MDTNVLCKWLDLPDWPPDHYALLGLKPGDSDTARLETQVHERMGWLRRYQISHPEEATEGMNRLAQAFICLSEALAKATCGKCEPVAKTQSAETLIHVVAETSTGLDWQQTPPPVRGTREPTRWAGAKDAPPVGGPASPFSSDEGAKAQIAEDFSKARRGLGTLPALIERIHLTRKLIFSWHRVGCYLKQPERKLRAAEEADLTRRLNQIFELMGEFPAIIGHPGRPGYRVVAMARLEMTAAMFRMLDASQRDCLAKDWQAGIRVLLCYRRFLLSEFKRWRGRNRVQRAVAAVHAIIKDHPIWVSVLAVALGVLVYRMSPYRLDLSIIGL